MGSEMCIRDRLGAFDLALDLLSEGRHPAEVGRYWRCELPLGLRRLLDGALAAELRGRGAVQGARESLAGLRALYAEALAVCGYDLGSDR